MTDDTEKLSNIRLISLIIFFLLQLPVWYAFLFGLLQAAEPAWWVWITFFLYVPVNLILSILMKVDQKQQREEMLKQLRKELLADRGALATAAEIKAIMGSDDKTWAETKQELGL